MRSALIILFVLCFTAKGRTQDSVDYVLDTTIALPGNDGYDYLFIDTDKRAMYVSHGSSVHVIDLNTERPIGLISGVSGCHGIAVAPASGKGFISEGKSNSVTVFNLATFAKIKRIPLSGKKPDAIIYDPYSKRYMPLMEIVTIYLSLILFL